MSYISAKYPGISRSGEKMSINVRSCWQPVDKPTYGSSSTKAPSIDVDIDIKPGGNPNSINLQSKGVVPVALLTTTEFDATTVDPVTVIFAGAMPIKWSTKDVDSDGDVDVVFHYKTRELNLDAYSTNATLAGQTIDPVYSISGIGSVNIVKN